MRTSNRPVTVKTVVARSSTPTTQVKRSASSTGASLLGRFPNAKKKPANDRYQWASPSTKPCRQSKMPNGQYLTCCDFEVVTTNSKLGASTSSTETKCKVSDSPNPDWNRSDWQ